MLPYALFMSRRVMRSLNTYLHHHYAPGTSIFHIPACLNVNRTLVTRLLNATTTTMHQTHCYPAHTIHYTQFASRRVLIYLCVPERQLHAQWSCVSLLNAYFDQHRAPDTSAFVQVHVSVCLFWTTQEYKREFRLA